MPIPLCTHEKARCINSRPRKEDGYRYRQYQCVACGLRWSTVEVPVKTMRAKVKGIDAMKRELIEQDGRYLSDQQQKAIARLIEAFMAPKD